MHVNRNNLELRSELKKMTDELIINRLKEQKSFVENLSKSYPHSIEIKKESIPNNPSTFDYNCHTFTFDIIDSQEVEAYASRHRDIFVGTKFVRFLIEKGYVKEKSWYVRKDGNIIIYFDKETPTHSGKIYSDKIISKWGDGNLWQHGIYEVPINYGNEIKVFSEIYRDVAIKAFLEFARIKLYKPD